MEEHSTTGTLTLEFDTMSQFINCGIKLKVIKLKYKEAELRQTGINNPNILQIMNTTQM